MAYRVFLSHSGRDRWIARQVARAMVEVLAARASAPAEDLAWLDEKDVDARISDSVRAGLLACAELVVLLSSASLDSAWVRHEVGAAWGQGKTITLLLDKISRKDIPGLWSDYPCFDLNDLDRYLEHLDRRAKEHIDAS